MKLERQQIIDAAIGLLDEVGLDDLTTRRLADRLHVQQPALYWHFASKRALVNAMGQEILRRHHTYEVPRPGDDWRRFIGENARSLRRALLAHRDGGRLHAGAEAEVEDFVRLESQLRCLVDAGFPVEIATLALISAGRFALGSAIDEQAEQAEERVWGQEELAAAAAKLPLFGKSLRYYRKNGPEAAFEAGLTLIVAGLEVELAGAKRKRRARAGARKARKASAG
ncbi:MAG: TetR/AcrR family transcriptional regulator C-terminal domain-containing protein [Bauldia sp.]